MSMYLDNAQNELEHPHTPELVVSGHPPDAFPRLGYFEKMADADSFFQTMCSTQNGLTLIVR